MKHRPAPLRVAIQVAVFIQAAERWWIRHPLVKVVDRFPGPRRSPLGGVFPVHRDASAARTSQPTAARLAPLSASRREYPPLRPVPLGVARAPGARAGRPGWAIPEVTCRDQPCGVDTCSITESRLNDAGFWRGGNFAKL